MAMTGYEMTKIANKKLATEGIKEIRPQMVYNYLKKGYIKNNDEKALMEWLDRYIAKKKGENVKINVDLTKAPENVFDHLS